MFKRYWRSYPLWLQFLLLILLIFSLVSLTSAIVGTMMRAWGITTAAMQQANEHSPRAFIDKLIWLQTVFSIGTYMLPALVYAYLSHPQPRRYLGLVKPGKAVQWPLAVGVMLGAMPVLMFIGSLMQQIDMGKGAREQQDIVERTTAAMLAMPTAWDFVKAFVIMAIVPAIGEELFFRGIFLRFIRKSSSNMLIPILFTAGIFSFVHGSPYNFVSIFFAGVLLAVIYQLTGSLWTSILAHCIYNGTQITVLYLGNNSPTLKAMIDSNQLPVSIVIGGAVLFGLSLFLLVKNKTPLQRYWAEDYTQEELAQNNNNTNA